MSLIAHHVLTAVLLVHAPSAPPADDELVARIDAALARSGRFLVEAQSADGAWRSETYGALKDGPSLTPYVMSCLLFLPQADPQASDAYGKGVEYLVGFVGQDGHLAVGSRELLFPVYTAASASRVVTKLNRGPRYVAAQRAWLGYLRQRQLDERLGWTPADPQYGGWGFSLEPPRKPPPGQLREFFCESNLAATVFALAALKSARVPFDDPAYAKARRFVERCQNFATDPARRDPAFDDGGFFFIPNDPVQNKAGEAGTDRFGRRRFHSYGTMTADGLRALLSCGLKEDHPRVVAARRWLERHYSPTENPGAFAADRAVLQNATYYYWTWSVAHAFLALRQPTMASPRGSRPWAKSLARELIERQRPDGTWTNRYTDAKEDDPLVATPWAAASLAICRSMLTGECPRIGGR